MLFNSFAYILFLPIVFFIYWGIPNKFRWILLLVSSYYFYMSWNPKYIILILGITIVSYISAILIEKAPQQRQKKNILRIVIILCLGELFIFKYFNFALTSLCSLMKWISIEIHPVVSSLLLPVGISFYTFQTLGYMIDVYNGKVPAEKHFGYYATYISFFPQLVAGPIERTSNLLPQVKSDKQFDYNTAMSGAHQMLWGFFKKIAIADVVGRYVDTAYGNLGKCTGFDLVIAIFFFTIQIYCDFSGYSDIAIGTARLFGIKLMENFSSPYFSLSIRDFWNRWHISLSTWFKDYVYIPLGGNRCSTQKAYRNLIITFLISGIWHGADWTFVLWGAIHGFGQILERIFKLDTLKTKKWGKFVSWFYTFSFCNFAWILFRAASFHDAYCVIANLFANLSNPSSFIHNNIGLEPAQFVFILFTIAIVAFYDYLSLKENVIERVQKMKTIPKLIIGYALIIMIAIGLMYSTGKNQFVYFQF